MAKKPLTSIKPKKKSGKTLNKKRTLGSLKGKIKMSKDFDALLVDFAPYM